MRLATRLGAWGALATLAGAALSPAVLADGRQSDKNTMRNLGYLGAAVAGYGLLHHDTTVGLLGAAAGGYGAYRYEQDRHSQDQAKRAWERRERLYHRAYYHRASHRRRYFHARRHRRAY